MSFSKLPNELILLIGGCLRMRALNSLSQTSKLCNALLTKSLYCLAWEIQSEGAEIVRNAVIHDCMTALSRLLEFAPASYFTSEPAHKALLTAAFIGRREALRLLLDAGVKDDLLAEGASPLKDRALREACNRGHREVVDFLFEAGAGISACSPVPVCKGDAQIALKLLQRGALVQDARTHPLSVAACRGYTELVNLLLDWSADINRVDNRTYASITPLFIAIRGGHLAMVRLLLDRGANVNMHISRDYTPLHHAIDVSASSEIVELLLERGADLFAGETTRGRGTPLQNAVRARDVSLRNIAALLQAGALEEDGDRSLVGALEEYRFQLVPSLPPLLDAGVLDMGKYRTFAVLREAVLANLPDVVRKLLDSGVSPDGLFFHGGIEECLTPAHEEVFLMLVSRLVKRNMKNQWGVTPLSPALRSRATRKMLLPILDQSTDVFFSNASRLLEPAAQNYDSQILSRVLECCHGVAHSGDALLRAAQAGRLENVVLLLDKGLDLHRRDDQDRTALEVAAGSGHLEIVKLLLQRSGNTASIHDSFYRKALVAAVTGQQLEAVKLLLEHGVNPEQKKDKKLVPGLSTASSLGYVQIVELLIKYGAHLEKQDANGHTALTYALLKGHAVVVELLLRHGAKAELVIDHKETLLGAASSSGYHTIVKLLLEYGVDTDRKDAFGRTALGWAARKGHTDIAACLLSRNADPNIKDNAGQGPLVLAASYGHIAIVKLLLASNSDPDAVDIGGRTPLICASGFGHADIVRLLIPISGKHEHQDRDGCTAFIHAARGRFVSVVQAFLDTQEGLDVDQLDAEGRSALSWAVSYSDGQEVARLLVKAGANLTIKDKIGHTPLFWAMIEEKDDMVRILYEGLMGA